MCFCSSQVTKQDEDLKVKEEEMKKLSEMAAKKETEVAELERRQQQLISVSCSRSVVIGEDGAELERENLKPVSCSRATTLLLYLTAL